jgi:hypothetical protein
VLGIWQTRPAMERSRELMRAHESSVTPEKGAPAEKKAGEPGRSPPIDTRHPGPITPGLLEFLYGKSDENYLLPSRAQRMVFDPKTGKPVLQGTRSPASAPVKQNWGDYFNFGPQLKRLVRDILDKDKRLDDADKDAIVEAVSARHGETGQNGKTIGDIAREEVERYLFEKASKKTTAFQIDAEAGVRILLAYAKDITGSSAFSSTKLLRAPVGVKEVVAAVHAIPKNRFEGITPAGISVRNLLEWASHFAVHDSIREAAKEKLSE